MKKSQVISMDFVMTFVVYLFALSVFFFFMKNAFSYGDDKLDVSAELVFGRLDQTYAEGYDFLEGMTIDVQKLDSFLTANYRPKSLYDFVFRDFENSAYFVRTDYCIFIENRTPGKSEIVANFAAYSSSAPGDYNITIVGDVKCGTNPTLVYDVIDMNCDRTKKIEAIVLRKPVLYGKDLMSLNILICAEKR